MDNSEELKNLLNDVKYRDQQINLLYDLLIRGNRFLYPLFHLYGLSGTGKTFLIKKFMKKFCDGSTIILSSNTTSKSKTSRKTQSGLVCKKYHVYLNCKEMCHNSTLSLFHEIVEQVKSILVKQNNEMIEMEEEPDLIISEIENVEKSSDCSNYIRQLKSLLFRLSNRNTKCKSHWYHSICFNFHANVL